MCLGKGPGILGLTWNFFSYSKKIELMIHFVRIAHVRYKKVIAKERENQAKE